jgi:heme-degrading monooxygenase HmoA
MAFIVIVRLQVRPERLADVLSLIRTEFARSQGSGRGRLRGHVFQRLGHLTDLLGCVEWDSQQAYEQYRHSLTHHAILDGLAAPSHAQYCTRLVSFERMLERSAVAACAVLASSIDTSAAVEQYVLQERRDEIISTPGLIAHEVYRTLKTPPRYIVVHRWQHLGDLERFRQDTGRREDQRLAELGGTLERFTGALVAQYPLDDVLPS